MVDSISTSPSLAAITAAPTNGHVTRNSSSSLPSSHPPTSDSIMSPSLSSPPPPFVSPSAVDSYNNPAVNFSAALTHESCSNKDSNSSRDSPSGSSPGPCHAENSSTIGNLQKPCVANTSIEAPHSPNSPIPSARPLSVLSVSSSSSFNSSTTRTSPHSSHRSLHSPTHATTHRQSFHSTSSPSPPVLPRAVLDGPIANLSPSTLNPRHASASLDSPAGIPTLKPSSHFPTYSITAEELSLPSNSKKKKTFLSTADFVKRSWNWWHQASKPFSNVNHVTTTAAIASSQQIDNESHRRFKHKDCNGSHISPSKRAHVLQGGVNVRTAYAGTEKYPVSRQVNTTDESGESSTDNDVCANHNKMTLVNSSRRFHRTRWLKGRFCGTTKTAATVTPLTTSANSMNIVNAKDVHEKPCYDDDDGGGGDGDGCGCDDRHIKCPDRNAINRSDDGEATEPAWPRGIRPYLTLLGCFFLMFNSWGLVNAYGTFSSFYMQTLMPGHDLLRLGTIGGTECFMLLSLSGVVGRILDAGHIRLITALGGIFVSVGMFGLAGSAGSGGYDEGNFGLIWLTQGLIVGIGTSCFFVSSSQIASTWFIRRKSTAIGIASTGASIGGLSYPLMTKYLIASLGWKSAILTVATVALVTCILAFFLALPNPAHKFRPPKKWLTLDVWFDSRAFLYKPYMWFVLGICWTFFGYYGVFFNLEEWATVKGVGYRDGTKVVFDGLRVITSGRMLTNNTLVPSINGTVSGGNNTVSASGDGGPPLQDSIRTFYLLSIMNGSSTIGRLGSAWLSDKFPTPLINFIATLMCSLLTLAVWMTASTLKQTLVFVVLFGIFSGTVIGLPPAAMAWILEQKAASERFEYVNSQTSDFDKFSSALISDYEENGTAPRARNVKSGTVITSRELQHCVSRQNDRRRPSSSSARSIDLRSGDPEKGDSDQCINFSKRGHKDSNSLDAQHKNTMARLGQWTGLMYTCASLPAFAGPVIMGHLVSTYRCFTPVQVWTGLCLLIASVCIFIAYWYARRDIRSRRAITVPPT